MVRDCRSDAHIILDRVTRTLQTVCSGHRFSLYRRMRDRNLALGMKGECRQVLIRRFESLAGTLGRDTTPPGGDVR